MERAERLFVLAFALLFETLLIPALWFMFVMTVITCGQRFAKVWKQASATVPQATTSTAARDRRRRTARRTERQTRANARRRPSNRD